eukprot:746467-Hanusia_phi.AAC.3
MQFGLRTVALVLSKASLLVLAFVFGQIGYGHLYKEDGSKSQHDGVHLQAEVGGLKRKTTSPPSFLCHSRCLSHCQSLCMCRIRFHGRYSRHMLSCGRDHLPGQHLVRLRSLSPGDRSEGLAQERLTRPSVTHPGSDTWMHRPGNAHADHACDRLSWHGFQPHVATLEEILERSQGQLTELATACIL